ncbi:MAG TPA: STAS domain-containing protein [Planctomycetaceae bacterium]|nr:STAS domain-containing protein [Planctomycetaceae bacterium]
MHATLQTQYSTMGETLKVRVIGAVDVDTSPAFREELQQAWNPSLKLMDLDFSEVQYISSPGIALLLEIRQLLAKDNAAVVVSAASQQVRDVLTTCRLDTMFLPDGHSGPPVSAAS